MLGVHEKIEQLWNLKLSYTNVFKVLWVLSTHILIIFVSFNNCFNFNLAIDFDFCSSLSSFVKHLILLFLVGELLSCCIMHTALCFHQMSEHVVFL